ncbi:MAG: DVU_1553 family AMP-dependent CoA ligase [Syntrophales bacterium]
MYLEEWIRDRVERDNEFTAYIKKESMNEHPREMLRAYQLFKLRKTLIYAYENSSFYRKSFDLKNFNPCQITSLDDLKHVPLVQQNDIKESPYRFLCISQADVARVFTLATSGSTGAPKKVFFNERDINTITDTMAAIIKTAFTCAGISDTGSLVYILMPGGTSMSQAQLIGRGVKKMGHIPLIGDIKAGIESQITEIESTRPVMIMGSAFRIHRLTQEARESHNLREIGMQVIFITSEYLSEPMRRNLEDFWGGEVYHHYGMTETGLGTAVECQFHDGFHFDETNFIFEVVNPETGEVVHDGEEGELVFTNLDREGMPLIRYLTGDIGRIITEPCQCGALSLQRIGKIKKRTKSIVTIGMGDRIYPSLFDNVIYTFPDVVDYQITLSGDDHGDAMMVEVEVIKEDKLLKDRIAQAVADIPLISQNIQNGYLISPEIKIMGKRSLVRKERAKRFIVDKRQGKPDEK